MHRLNLDWFYKERAWVGNDNEQMIRKPRNMRLAPFIYGIYMYKYEPPSAIDNQEPYTRSDRI